MFAEDDILNQQQGLNEDDLNPAPSHGDSDLDPAAEAIVFTVPEVALRLRVDLDTVMDLIKTGRLPAVYLGSGAGYRVTLADLKEFFRSQKEQTRAEAAEVFRHVETERQAMAGLCDWLKQEKEELGECCRLLSKAVESTIHKLNHNLDNARQSGDHSRVKAINGALFTIFDKWSSPRFAFSDHITKGERRWRDFCTNCREDGPEVKAVWTWLRQEGVIPHGPLNLSARYVFPQQHKQTWEERNMYQNLYLWLRQEQEALIKHYNKMDKSVKKILHSLKSASKKAGKNMDFYESQAYNEAMLNLYESWEEARLRYNNWLEGSAERWHEFKRKLHHLRSNDSEV